MSGMKGEIKSALSRVLPKIKNLTKMIEHAEDSWPDHYRETSPEDMYQRRMFERIAEKLGDVRRLAEQVAAEVTAEGRLYRNFSGRYELPSGASFTSGSSIEFLHKNSYGDTTEWISSRVEHNGTDYYIVAAPDIPMDGVTARTKRIT